MAPTVKGLNPPQPTPAPQQPDLSKIPAVPAPGGEVSNFDNPDNKITATLVLISVCLAIMTIMMLVRIYTRTVVKKSMGLDDYLALVAWALTYVYSVSIAVATHYGFGHHIWDISVAEVVVLNKCVTISQKTYFLAVMFIKLCILWGYNRIFHVDKATKWAIWLGIFAVSVFYIVTFAIDLAAIVSFQTLPWATGIFSIVTDFYVLLLPLPLILGLNMSRGRKIRVVAVFSLGLFTCICSIMRMVQTQQFINVVDQTNKGVIVAYWAILEVNVGLICACATVIPAFFDSKMPKSFGSLINRLLSTTGSRIESTSESNLTKSPEHQDSSAQRSMDADDKDRPLWRILSKPSYASLNRKGSAQ